LPHGGARRVSQPVDAPGDRGFERAHDGGQRSRPGFPKPSFVARRGTARRAPTAVGAGPIGGTPDESGDTSPSVDAPPSAVITMIPCTWLGITTNASNMTLSRTRSVRRHSAVTTRPYAFSDIRPRTTSPKRHTRSCVHTVTK
jgi:hypothetical protein